MVRDAPSSEPSDEVQKRQPNRPLWAPGARLARIRYEVPHVVMNTASMVIFLISGLKIQSGRVETRTGDAAVIVTGKPVGAGVAHHGCAKPTSAHPRNW
jgi:hypothetical protein